MTRWRALRKRTFEVLVLRQRNDLAGRCVDALILSLVAANVVAVILESVATLGTAYAAHFDLFERFSVGVFSIEFVLRVWVAAEKTSAGDTPGARRFRYVRSPMALIDLAAIVPFYLSAIFSLDLRVLRMLRLLRIMKLTRYSHAFSSMGDVLKLQRGALSAAGILLGFAIILSASLIWIAESRAQPLEFGSIPAAMWWAICTITTVGYGDVTPVTPVGKIVGSFVAIIGVATVALPTSLLGAGYIQIMDRRERVLEDEAWQAVSDGVLTEDESRVYRELAESLHVDSDVAREIIDSVQRRQELRDLGDCPHCGKSIDT
jgi:voltage-gated potassium channel